MSFSIPALTDKSRLIEAVADGFDVLGGAVDHVGVAVEGLGIPCAGNDGIGGDEAAQLREVVAGAVGLEAAGGTGQALAVRFGMCQKVERLVMRWV